MEEQQRLWESLSALRREVYLRTEIGRLPDDVVGVQASYMKIAPEKDHGIDQRLEDRRDRTFDKFRTGRTRQIFLADAETGLETLGFWDWVTLRYRDDLYDLTQAEEPRMEDFLGFKSFCGTVLATNSGVEKGQIAGPPLGLEDDRRRGLFAHYKLNPFLLFTGRSDLMIHTAQFIALLISANDVVWKSTTATEAWTRVIARMGLEPQPAADLLEETQGTVIPAARELAAGVEFLVFENMDWNDLSIYLMGDSTTRLARLAMFFREMPVLYPRFVSSFKALLRTAEQDAEPILGEILDEPEAQSAERSLASTLDICQRLYERLPDPKAEWVARASSKEYIPELTVFSDYTDVFTLPSEQDEAPDVRYVQRLNIKAGRMAESQQSLDPRRGEVSDPIGKMQIMSGPVDIAQHHSGSREDLAEVLYERSTLALVPLAGTPFHPRQHPRGSIYKTLEPLLKHSFDTTDRKKVVVMMSKLSLPRATVRALRTIIIQHLSYKSDPVMVNTLYDYLHLWRNLQEGLLDCLERAENNPPPGARRAIRTQAFRNMTVLVEKVSQAINARYHSSSRMFEVTDLNHNHKGGAELLLNAYSQMVYRIIHACAYIDHRSHIGIVKVGEGGAAHINSGFASITEMDWLRLACPENSFVIVHELGHEVLKDPVLAPLYWFLCDEESWDEIARKGRLLDQPAYSSAAIELLFEDMFCDLFMIYIAACSLGREVDDSLRQELQEFYDRLFWTQAEMRLKTIFEGDSQYVCLQIVRWYMVRSSIDFLYPLRTGNVKDSDKTSRAIDDYLTEAQASVKRRAARHREILESSEKQFLSSLEDLRKNRPPAEQRTREEGDPPSQQGDEERLGSEQSESKGSWETFFETALDTYSEFQLVGMPSSEDWAEELLPLLERYCPRVRELSRVDGCQRCDGECSGSRRSRCEAFHSDSLGALFDYLRPIARQGNKAQMFLLFCHFFLDRIVDEKKPRERLASISEAYELNQSIFREMFESGSSLIPYAKYNAHGGLQEAAYTPIIINPRGSALIFDSQLRQSFLARRLNILNRLSEDRLKRVARKILEASETEEEARL